MKYIEVIKKFYPLLKAFSRGMVFGFAFIGVALSITPLINKWQLSGNWFLIIPLSIGLTIFLLLIFLIAIDIPSIIRKSENNI